MNRNTRILILVSSVFAILLALLLVSGCTTAETPEPEQTNENVAEMPVRDVSEDLFEQAMRDAWYDLTLAQQTNICDGLDVNGMQWVVDELEINWYASGTSEPFYRDIASDIMIDNCRL